MADRRFPPPWTVEGKDACFIVRDHNGQALSYVYFEEEPGRRSAAKLLTRDGRDANGLFPLFYRLGSGLRLPTWIGDLVFERLFQFSLKRNSLDKNKHRPRARPRRSMISGVQLAQVPGARAAEPVRISRLRAGFDFDDVVESLTIRAFEERLAGRRKARRFANDSHGTPPVPLIYSILRL